MTFRHRGGWTATRVAVILLACITADAAPKVADFGVAIRSDRQRPTDRTATTPIGNLAFMSPSSTGWKRGP